MIKTQLKKKKIKNLAKAKYSDKILEVKRVTKVVKGGKILTFRAVVVVGNNKGKVGVGIGKSEDANLAIEKGILAAKKKLINVPMTVNFSIPHVIEKAYGASKIVLRPAINGTGIIAGGAIRTVLELSGIKNVLGKQLGSKNLLNNAKATVSALAELNQKVETAKFQLIQKRKFYRSLMKSYKST